MDILAQFNINNKCDTVCIDGAGTCIVSIICDVYMLQRGRDHPHVKTFNLKKTEKRVRTNYKTFLIR